MRKYPLARHQLLPFLTLKEGGQKIIPTYFAGEILDANEALRVNVAIRKLFASDVSHPTSKEYD